MEQKIDDRHTALFRSLYEKEKDIDYFLSDIEQSKEYCMAEKRIITIISEEDDALVGHCSLILPKGENQGAAYFGFFELGKEEDFEEFWGVVVAEAKRLGVRTLTGPVNGSVWLPYRFIATSDGSPLFKGELPTDPTYHGHFSKLGYGKITSYSSGMRKRYDAIVGATRASFDAIADSGLEISAASEITRGLLDEIRTLSMEIFSNTSVAYEPFPAGYFLKLYGGRLSDPFRIYLVRDGEALAGFCFVTYEDKATMILKTLAVHPRYQKRGIGSALAHAIHRDATDEGIEKIIYALVRDDNQIKNFPKDDVSIVRTYSLFELSL